MNDYTIHSGVLVYKMSCTITIVTVIAVAALARPVQLQRCYSAHSCTHIPHMTDLSSCRSSRMTKMIQGTDRRSMVRLRAGLRLLLGLIRQSVESAPLLREEKAKLEKLKSQDTVLGAGTLALPSKLMY